MPFAAREIAVEGLPGPLRVELPGRRQDALGLELAEGERFQGHPPVVEVVPGPLPRPDESLALPPPERKEVRLRNQSLLLEVE